VRLQIGEPSFSTPEHIRLAAMRSLESELLTYGPRTGWPWLLELIADKVRRVNGYEVDPDNIAIAVGGTGAVQTALTATVGPGDEVLLSDPCWALYFMQITPAVPPPLRIRLILAASGSPTSRSWRSW